MLGRTTGAVLVGVDAHLIEVEVDLSGGLPTISAVGLPDVAVREGIDRIRAALRHAGFKLPQRRVTVNLAPADVRKHGAGLDLPIAAALLLADGQIGKFDTSSTLLAGELALDGTLRPIHGALSLALAARDAGYKRVLLPRANAAEAALIPEVDAVPLGQLADLVAFTLGRAQPVGAADARSVLRRAIHDAREPDLRDVRGQSAARRALEICAAGGHHLLLSGPPGAGKTMLARRLPGILPPMELDEALEVTRVWSAAGLGTGLITRRPFRAPHHGISFAGLTGGGLRLRPGEISLAARGVLYLDELTEFRRDALEALRQPLEEGTITVVRLYGRAVFPAAFTLVASMNPCPCGYHGQPDGRCDCSPQQVRRYRGKLSGPLLDRFDLVVDVPPLDPAVLRAEASPAEASSEVRGRVVEARERQRHRHRKEDASPCNAMLSSAQLSHHAALGRDESRLLEAAARRIGLSARGYDRVRRVARTVADLEGEAAIGVRHLAEALQYRPARELRGD